MKRKEAFSGDWIYLFDRNISIVYIMPTITSAVHPQLTFQLHFAHISHMPSDPQAKSFWESLSVVWSLLARAYSVSLLHLSGLHCLSLSVCGIFAVWHISKRSLAQFKAQSGTVQSAVWHSSKCSLAHFKAQSSTFQSAVWHISKCSLAQFKAQSGTIQSAVWHSSRRSLAQFKAQSGTVQGTAQDFPALTWPFHRSRWTIFACIDYVYLRRIASYWCDPCIFDMPDSDCYKVIVIGI